MLTSDQIDVLRGLSGQVVDPVVEFLIRDIARRKHFCGARTIPPNILSRVMALKSFLRCSLRFMALTIRPMKLLTLWLDVIR